MSANPSSTRLDGVLFGRAGTLYPLGSKACISLLLEQKFCVTISVLWGFGEVAFEYATAI